LLDAGFKAPEIQRMMVEEGFDPEPALDKIMGVVEERVRGERVELERERRADRRKVLLGVLLLLGTLVWVGLVIGLSDVLRLPRWLARSLGLGVGIPLSVLAEECIRRGIVGRQEK
jgi:hypothetical protein